MIQAVSCKPVTAEGRVRSHVSPYEIFGTRLLQHVTSTGRGNGRSLGTVQKAALFLKCGSIG